MPTWNSRGLRGSTLEELVNLTNELYTEKNLALMQKIPTPITPVKIDSESGQIKLAYFEKDSPSTISGWYRAFRSASMQRSARQIHFHSGISMNTRFISCGNLRSSGA